VAEGGSKEERGERMSNSSGIKGLGRGRWRESTCEQVQERRAWEGRRVRV
jgi:hypothetical protein